MRNGHKNMIQNHAELAYRLRRMAWAIERRGKLTEDEAKALHSLREQEVDHIHKAQIQNTFVLMI